ncbi:MAG: S9 family peptidase [Deltaproteobacteria bacterium]|nr:MAG: S9 family peptidase [Deltaproteobacteria bacterium]
MADKQKSPYGLWPSALTPRIMSQSVRLREAQWDTDGETLVWMESRSARGVLVASRRGEAPRDLTEQHSVAAGVGYGGGDFTVGHGWVVFVEKSGRLFRQSLDGGQPHPITPEFGKAASPVIDPSGKKVMFIHSYEGQDALAVVDIEGKNWPQKWASGCDFYMQPAWHPTSQFVAWVEWDHPNMPWDGTRLQLAQLSEEGNTVTNTRHVAGDSSTRIFQPEFSPDGKTLSYITTHNDLDALVLVDMVSAESRILVEGEVIGAPAWVQGMRTYGWTGDSQTIFYRRNDQGFAQLCSVNVETGEVATHEWDNAEWIDQVSIHPNEPKVVAVTSSSKVPTRITGWSKENVVVHRRSSGENIPPDDFAQPQPLSWKANDGTEVYGLFYPPTHSQFEGEGLPPAIVAIHGGPTVQRVASYNSDAAFFTSRGFAYMEVNYRGSSGYGKAYLDALKGQWGVLDVEDAVGAAKTLADQRLADPKRLVIKGGSAGGYTVLGALVQYPGVFRAGVSLFGISNLFTLVADTHKFESRYVDSLIGPLPDAADLYRERSPYFHAEKIQDPVAIFQGADDKVVPPNQAEAIVSALRSRGVPHLYTLYEGEGHGWRKQETIDAYYTELMVFLKEHVLFA